MDCKQKAGGENSIIARDVETEHSQYHFRCENIFRETQLKFFGFEFVNH